MLVLDPTRRYSIEQIKRHRWMLAEVVDIPVMQPISACGTSAYEPNEQILRLMSNLGIDAQKTRESLKLNSYDHHAAIYLLLMERLKHRSMSQDGTAVSGHIGKHPSLEQQKRRPSSIAEQAMRKLGLSHQRSIDPSISPRHHHMSINAADLQSPLIGPLRETNIREQPQLRESAIFTPPQPTVASMRTSTGGYNTPSGLSSNLFLNREREFVNNPGGGGQHSPLFPVTPPSLAGCGTGLKESSTALIQKEIQSGISSLGISHRAPSNRLLSSGIDQRILKQSSEDCRRLLQQVGGNLGEIVPSTYSFDGDGGFFSLQATAVADPNRNGTSTATPTPSPQNPLEFNPTAATTTTPVHPHPSGRHLSSSNSFDAKSHLAGFSLGYQMPVEATRLINTLQQSPLPLPSTVANSTSSSSNSSTTTAPPSDNMIRSDTYRYLAHSHADQQPPAGVMAKDKLSNFGDLARNLHSYSYLQGGGSDGDHASLLPRHNQITQQYSSSTDEGCDTDHGGEWNLFYL